MEDAIEAAAPEVAAIEVVEAKGRRLAGRDPGGRAAGPAEQGADGSGEPVSRLVGAAAQLADLEPGEVAGFLVGGGYSILACRTGQDVYAYRDYCPRCTRSLEGATLQRALAAPAGGGLLRCPSCRSHFDVRQAGACLEDKAMHLDPLPLLSRGGVMCVAVPGVRRARTLEMDIALLRKIAATKRTETGARCEMCGEPIAEQHQHVVDVESRGLLCTCRPCYLLFTDSTAWLRYRAVPDRYHSFPDFQLGPGQWEDLEIPVGLAFFFANSALGRTVAFYPGPAEEPPNPNFRWRRGERWWRAIRPVRCRR